MISCPTGSWFGKRKVFTSSPSPHAIIPEKRLNHFPFGASGSRSSQLINSTNCSSGISRLSTRFMRWSKRDGGKFLRRILGMWLFAVEAFHNCLFQTGFLIGIVRFNHAFGQQADFFSRKLAVARTTPLMLRPGFQRLCRRLCLHALKLQRLMGDAKTFCFVLFGHDSAACRRDYKTVMFSALFLSRRRSECPA